MKITGVLEVISRCRTRWSSPPSLANTWTDDRCNPGRSAAGQDQHHVGVPGEATGLGVLRLCEQVTDGVRTP